MGEVEQGSDSRNIYACASKPAAFNQYEPYTIAIIRTKDGVGGMGWLEDVESEDVKVV